MNPKNVVARFMWPLIFMIGAISFFSIINDPSIKTLVYSDLLKEVDKTTIKKITIYSDGAVEGEFKAPQDGKTRFKSNIGEGDSAFLSRKLENQIPIPEIIKQNKVPSFWEIVLSWLPTIFIVGFFLYMMRGMMGGARGGLGNFMKPKAKLDQKLKPVFFKDVAGADEAKRRFVVAAWLRP